jgi:hypothetical protein
MDVQMRTTKFDSDTLLPDARRTENLLASDQMAIYPISLLGLETGGVGAETSGAGETSLIGGATGSALHPQMGDTLSGQFKERSLLREQMNDLAHQTGGEAFVGTNDFARALRVAMIDGSNYYTLAYRPRNERWDGRFRKIHAELLRKGCSLTYRRGYFASPDTNSSASSVQQLHAALQSGTPESTMLQLKSTIEPPNKQRGSLYVHSLLDPTNLGLTLGEDGHRRGRILVVLVAFNDTAGPAGSQSQEPPQTSGVLNLDFDATQYQVSLKQGIAFTQQLSLAPGRYRLRLGVSDMNTQQLGTIDMPIVVTPLSSQKQ